ncbi:MAG: hypothetical protein KGJ84_16820 [Elusimicrobia bacterium]|nr:hypothetical protein [Elusimicrobiota bacterium]
MQTRKLVGGLLTAAALLAGFARAEASGLRTPLGEVIIRNLKIGQTYSMYKLLNLPMRVVNTGDDNIDLKISTVRPTRLNDGYEEVPSLDWVHVEQSTFTVAPNREAMTDLVIAIPNDPALMGRRFQADIWTHSTDPRALQVGLQSHIMLQIDSTPPTEEELKKKFVNEQLANLDFTVLPINATAADIPLGRAVDLRKERKISIKIVNPNDQALNFRARSIPVWESVITPPAGFEDAPNAQWLRPDKEILKVDGNSIADMGLTLEIPDKPVYRGRHFLFLVTFEVLEQKIPTRIYYRLFVDTANEVKAEPAGKK